MKKEINGVTYAFVEKGFDDKSQTDRYSFVASKELFPKIECLLTEKEKQDVKDAAGFFFNIYQEGETAKIIPILENGCLSNQNPIYFHLNFITEPVFFFGEETYQKLHEEWLSQAIAGVIEKYREAEMAIGQTEDKDEEEER